MASIEERRLPVAGAASAVKWIVSAVIIVSAVAIFGVVAVTIFAPDQSAILPILGFTTPVIVSLLGGGLLKVALALDGQRSLLVRTAEEKAHAEGVIKGLIVNPKVNVDAVNADIDEDPLP